MTIGLEQVAFWVSVFIMFWLCVGALIGFGIGLKFGHKNERESALLLIKKLRYDDEVEPSLILKIRREPAGDKVYFVVCSKHPDLVCQGTTLRNALEKYAEIFNTNEYLKTRYENEKDGETNSGSNGGLQAGQPRQGTEQAD